MTDREKLEKVLEHVTQREDKFYKQNIERLEAE